MKPYNTEAWTGKAGLGDAVIENIEIEQKVRQNKKLENEDNTVGFVDS